MVQVNRFKSGRYWRNTAANLCPLMWKKREANVEKRVTEKPRMLGETQHDG